MSLYYDESFTKDRFSQLNVSSQNSNSTMTSTTASPAAIPSDNVAVHHDNNSTTLSEQLGFPLEEVFNMARQFLKEKQGSKAIHLSYADNVRFAALNKQATIGKWDSSHTSNVGLLDVVGNDRKQAWIGLGEMSKEQAMDQFIKLLLERCPMFQHYVEAHHVENEEKDRLRKEDENRRALEQEVERLRQKEIEQVSRFEEQRKKREEFQRKQIQEALNQQTYPEFKAFAEQQYRNNRQAQDELIRQLQQEHFQQYMQQIYQEQLRRTTPNMDPTANQSAQVASAPVGNTTTFPNGKNNNNDPLQTQFESLSLKKSSPRSTKGNDSIPSVQLNTEYQGQDEQVNIHSTPQNENEQDLNEDFPENLREYPPIAPANMWTRKDIKEFKETLRKEKDAVIKIGSGETVTVRVPTHEEGRCIFWEFATDYYDVGFGLYFEWSKVQSNTVTVHVSDSSEDDEDADGEDGMSSDKKDIEKGSRNSNKPPKPYQDEIVPIFRRDSHEEIYAGSHTYPGHGVYLLKFDNSYSLWRSKTLYYRVYYSR